MRAKSLQLCLTLCYPMDCSPPGSSVYGLSSQEYWSGVPLPSPGDLPDPGIEPVSPVTPKLAGGVFINSTTWEALSHALCPKNQNIKQKQYFNKFNRDFKNDPHQKSL